MKLWGYTTFHCTQCGRDINGYIGRFIITYRTVGIKYVTCVSVTKRLQNFRCDEKEDWIDREKRGKQGFIYLL